MGRYLSTGCKRWKYSLILDLRSIQWLTINIVASFARDENRIKLNYICIEITHVYIDFIYLYIYRVKMNLNQMIILFYYFLTYWNEENCHKEDVIYYCSARTVGYIFFP